MNVIQTPDAPAAIGPYAQAIVHGGVVYCSGQVALPPAGGDLVAEDIEGQTAQVLRNLDAVLRAAGSSLSRALQVTVFMADMGEFQAMNAVYASVFGDARPARQTVEVSALPRGARVEISCIAAV